MTVIGDSNSNSGGTMVHATAQKSAETARILLDRIRINQQISRKDYLYLAFIILSNASLSEAERRQINRLFDDVQTGRLPLFDEA